MISSLLHLVGLRPRVYYTLTNFRGGGGGQGSLAPPPLNTPMLIKEATQLTQIVNLLDKPPDTDIPIRPPDTDIPTRPPDTDIPNRPINIFINNNPPDPGKPPDRNIPNRRCTDPLGLDIDIPNRLSDSDR